MRPKILLLMSFLGLSAASSAEAGDARIEQIVTTDEEVAAARARNPRDGRVIEYDLRTQLLRRMAPPTPPPGSVVEILPGEGDWGGSEPPRFKDFSGYVKIADPTQGIFPKHVKLRMIWNFIGGPPDSTDCSGTLVGPYHVLTAGHCAFSAQDPTRVLQAAAISVRPGWTGTLGPAGFANVVTMRSFTGWTDQGDYDDDIALLTLDRPVGALVGWRGANATSNWDYFDNLTWQSWSYPADNRDPNDPPLSGDDMYYQLGDFDYDDAPLYGWNRPGYGGTSGGGSIKDGQVWSVHSHTRTLSNGDVDSYDAALTSSKLTAIYTWIGDDEPDWPELTPLDTTCENSSGIAGGTFGSISFLVHNRGAVDFTGGTLYTIRIGTTLDTKASDTYVFDGYDPDVIPARGSKRITLNNLVVPPELTSGLYYVGVDLNPNDVEPSNDMTGPQDTVPFSVTCANQQAPQPVSPVDGHPCVGSDITLDWGSVPGVGVQYKVWLYKSEYGWGTTVVTSSTQHTFYGLDEDEDYHWRVAALPACGGQSAWSNEFDFHVTGILNAMPFLDPAPSTTCVGTSVTVNWDTTPWADLYRIRVENQTTAAVDYYDVTAPPLILGGLLPDSRYQLRLQWRNECLDWSRRSHVEFTTVASGTPNVPTLATPIDGNYTGMDPTLEIVYEPTITSVEYEIKDILDDVIVNEFSNYQLAVTGFSGGIYFWRARQEACTTTGSSWGQWSDWQSFEVDDQPPFFSGGIAGVSHSVGVWSSNDLVTVNISDAMDNCCIEGYWLGWDQQPMGIPLDSFAPTVGYYESVLPDGENWFHVMAVDGNGNGSSIMHFGPILIDTTVPEAVEPVANIPANGYANVDRIDVSWPASTDLGSGVAGYSYAWSTSPSYVLDETIDSSGLTTSLDPAPEGSRYFYVRAIDALGQAGPVVSRRYFVDRTGPIINQFDPDDWTALLYGEVVQFYTPLSDLAAPRDIVLHHFYSVDGGSFWYDAVCGGGLCQTSPLCGATTSQTCNISAGNDTYSWKVPWVPPGSQTLYRILAVDPAGNSTERIGAQPFTVTGITTDTPAIHGFALVGNTPNPFNPRTAIRYTLADDAQVTLDIFDLGGRHIVRLVDELQFGPRAYAVDWDGRDVAGRRVSSGVYLYRLRAGHFVQTKRMALLK